MNMTSYLIMILGMTAVTYLPRLIPGLFSGMFKFSGKVEKFLKLIPYTAMAALIFPGILSSDETNVVVGIVGGAVAALLAWKKLPVMLCVLGAVFADLILYLVI